MIQKDLLPRFRDYLQYERRYSDHTVASYSRDLEQLTRFLTLTYAMEDPSAATHQHIRSWIVSLLKGSNKAISVRRKLSSASHFYKWLQVNGQIANNPVVKIQLPKTPERLPKSISATAIQKLWEASDNDQSDGIGYLRDRVIIGLLYGGGLRRSELIQLKWGDFDNSRQSLRVGGKGRKYRQVPVNPELRKVLLDLREKVSATEENITEKEIICLDNGKPCYPKFVHNRVTSLLATVTTADKKSPHILRHSMATHMMNEGAELNAVKAILGHASLASTQVYTHNSISRLKDVYRQAHPNFKKNG